MPGPALGPGHASPQAFPSTGRLPSTLSAPDPSVGVVRGFLGTMQPSDPSDLPIRLRLLAFPNRPGTAVAACGRPEVSQVPTRSVTARTGLRLRRSDGPSHDGPARVAC